MGGVSMARQRKRSVHGGGSVFQRKDGRWEAKFKVEETGKYKSLYADTEREAYKKLEEAKFQQRQGTLPAAKDQTVKQFLEYWLEDVEKPGVGVSTYVNNRVVIRKHLIPGLGHFKLQKLTAYQLQVFYARKLKEGASASRIVRFHAVLHKALDHAKRMKLVGTNVSEGLDLPKLEHYEASFLVPDQASLLLREAKTRDLDALIALALITAMRLGEVLGLRWSDIDFDKGVLRITRTVNYYTGYGFVEGKPKTESGKRTIVLPRVVIKMLYHHRDVQKEKQARAGTDWVDNNLVFCGKKGGFMVRTTLKYQFDKLLDDVGLPHIRFHDLRHSAATILLSMGIPIKVVQELLGHSDVAMTLRVYGHVMPSMSGDAASGMDGLFED
jgi:integrase